MLNSALNILKHFVTESILRFNFEHFEIIRTDVEEVFYLVAIHGNWFLVFETDYIMDISGTYDEAQRIFSEDFTIEGWIPVGAPDSAVDPKASKQTERELIDAISFSTSGFYYAVMKLTPREPITLSSPTAYGGSIKR